MFCRHCGKENSPQMKFCVHCGKPLPQAAGTAQTAGQKFCRTCGTRLDQNGHCPKCRKVGKNGGDSKGIKVLLIVLACLILLVALVGGGILAFDLLKPEDEPEEEPRWTVAPTEEPGRWGGEETLVPPEEETQVTATEDPAEEEFREVLEKCRELEESEDYHEIVKLLRFYVSDYPEDPRYLELYEVYGEQLMHQVLDTAYKMIEQGQFRDAAEYIDLARSTWECDEYDAVLEICRKELSKPLSECYVLEDTNHSGTSSDVCPGDWEDVYGDIHTDSVRYWVIDQAGYQNTEYAVYQLDKAYQTLSGEIATAVKSDGGSDAVIEIYLDGVLAYVSPTVSASSGVISFEVDVSGVSRVQVLCTTSTGKFNYCIVDAILYEI